MISHYYISDVKKKNGPKEFPTVIALNNQPKTKI